MNGFSKQLMAFICAIALWPAYAPTATAQITGSGDAINKAGSLRMLSFRSTKAFLQIVQTVEPERSKETLADSIALFDKRLADLTAAASNAEIKKTYAALLVKWQAHKALLAKPTTENSLAAIESANELFEIANNGTRQYESLSTKPAGRLTNIAGRQRMLSQRMSVYFHAINASLMPAGAQVELTKSREEFVKAMQVLRGAKETTPEIAGALDVANDHWRYFDTAIQQLGGRDRKTFATHVAVTSERVLSEMDRVTGMYAALEK
jgi:hypothetical protein